MQAKYPAASHGLTTFACHSGRASIPASRTSVAAIATINALELLMPDAGGRSLPKAMSAPSAAPGKFFASRRTTVSA